MTTATYAPFVQAELTTTVYPDRSALAAYDGWHIVLAETDGDPEYDWSVMFLDREGHLGIRTLHAAHTEARGVFDDLCRRIAAPEFCPMCGAWTSCPCYDTPELEMDARLRQKLGRWTAPVIDETDVPY